MTTILDDTTAAKSTAQCCTREKEAKVGAGVWVRWTAGSHSGDGHVGAAGMCKQGNQLRSSRNFRSMESMELMKAEQWAI